MHHDRKPYLHSDRAQERDRLHLHRDGPQCRRDRPGVGTVECASSLTSPRRSATATSAAANVGPVLEPRHRQRGHLAHQVDVTSGELPAGLRLDATTGAITGSPTPQSDRPLHSDLHLHRHRERRQHRTGPDAQITVTSTDAVITTRPLPRERPAADLGQLAVKLSNAPLRVVRRLGGALTGRPDLDATTGAIYRQSPTSAHNGRPTPSRCIAAATSCRHRLAPPHRQRRRRRPRPPATTWWAPTAGSSSSPRRGPPAASTARSRASG